MALVFPPFMLLVMVSAGAMGGGILSAIARALGAGDRERANALVWHAVAITLVLSLTTTAVALLWAPKLYALMGGRDGSLADAVRYSNIIFIAAVPLWLFNSFAAMIRATGNMFLPAAVIVAGAVFLIPVSPMLIFGLGPLPQLGIAGGAVAVLIYYVVGCVIFAVYLWSGRGVLSPSLWPSRLSLGAAQGNPARRRGVVGHQPVDQCDRRGGDRTCRPGRARRCRRLRHRRAPRIYAGAAGVRARPAGRRHGRHRDRRRQERARPTRGVDRRGDCRRHHRSDRACRRAVSRRLAVAVRRRSRHARLWQPVSAHCRPVLRLLRRRPRALFRRAGRRPSGLAGDGGDIARAGLGRRRVACGRDVARQRRPVRGACGRAGDLRYRQCGPDAGAAWRRRERAAPVSVPQAS